MYYLSFKYNLKENKKVITMEHMWVRDYDIVDHSCAYCKTCKLWYAEYCNNGYPECKVNN